MLINGEKYACQSCIKGHRVSGCNHDDRELKHINPKGRPVKQCEHCRGARKSKAHHAKCDCGSKKSKDKQKDQGDAKVNGKGCCCHAGAKCICGVKKESIDLKLDTSKMTLHAARSKPTLKTAQSENALTVFANGHHKPCHRNNFTAHVSGAPYRIPRPHTLHGSAAFASYTQSHSPPKRETTLPRAKDTLAVSNNDFYTIFGSSQRPLDSVPVTPLTGSLDPSAFQDSIFAAPISYASETNNSPIEAGASFEASWPWAPATSSVNANYGYGSLSTSPSQDYPPQLDNDWAIPSAGLGNPSWSAGDLPLDPSKLNNTMTQPISNGGLTTASSSQSEAGEPQLFGELEYKKAPSAASESLFWDDNPVFRFPPVQNNLAMAPAATPSYIEAAPLTKDILSTIPSTNPTDKGALFPTTEFDDLYAGAIVMPNNDAPVDSWLNQNSFFNDGPDFFGMPPQQPWS